MDDLVLEKRLRKLELRIRDTQTIEERGVSGGYASLGTDGKVPSNQLPSSGSGDMLKSAYDPDEDGVIVKSQLDPDLTDTSGTNTGDNATNSQYSTLATILLACYPVGCIYQSIVSTSPATLFGGTWVAFGTGRVLVGIDGSDPDFDTVEETQGAKTVQSSAQSFSGTPFTAIINHTHPVNDPGHTHVLTELRDATTGGATTNIAVTADTTSTIGTKVTGSRTTGLTTNNPSGGVASITPAGTNTPGAATSVVQPSIVVYRWKRTA